MIRSQQLNGDTPDALQNKLHLKDLELNSLLEVTEAINSNVPEESLYKIFHFTLIVNLKIKKLALYVLDDAWSCKVNYGTSADFKSTVLPDSLLQISEVSRITTSVGAFNEFDILIPVAHKSKALACIFVGGLQEDSNEKTDLSFLQTFANIILVAIENKKLARKELQQEVFRKELEIARGVQAMLFPKELPFNDKLKIKASYFPHISIGGDYYDYLPLNENSFLICIADVSGKGIPAALLMSNFQASLRTLIRQTTDTDLKEIICELNYIIRNNAKGERFITFFTAIVNTREKIIQYINAGHNAPVLLSGNTSTTLETGTTILGIFDELPFLEEGSVKFAKDALLFAYTDGLTETSNSAEEEFGLDKLINFIEKHRNFDPEKLHEKLHRTLNEFRGKVSFPDDITYLSCHLGRD